MIKILSIGSDRNLFKEKSVVRERMAFYAQSFKEMHIVVFNSGTFFSSHKFNNVFVYPTNSSSRLFYVFDAYKIAKKIIKNNNSGNDRIIISCQDPFEAGIVGLLLKLLYGLPLQIQVHTDFNNRYFIFHSFLNFLRFIIALFILPFADVVRVVSLRIAESIRDFNKNIFILPVFIQKKETKLLNRESDSIFNILMVSRLEKEKDIKSGIGAFKIFSQKFPQSNLTIVGDGREKESLKKICQKTRLDNKIIFTGWQENLEIFYQKADVFLSTSLYEGYGLAMIEAASFGLPLVISDAGVAREIFKNGESAIICKPRDIFSFADAIEKIYLDRNLREKIGLTAKEVSEKVFYNPQVYLQKYKESFDLALINYRQKNFLSRLLDFFVSLFRANKILRFLICGGLVALTQILLLYFLTEKVGLWYLFSSILSFIYAVIASFLLQKFLVFRDKNTQKLRVFSQFLGFIFVALLGIFINTGAMYFLVEILNFWYVLAQILTGLFIMIINFLIYKFFIFKNN